MKGAPIPSIKKRGLITIEIFIFTKHRRGRACGGDFLDGPK
jgi:hypothetical protein